MVGPLPRQAEDRDVHAAGQDPRRDHLARAAARDRRDLEPSRARRRRALDAAERAAAFHRARRVARRLRAPPRGRAHLRRRVRRHGAQHHRLSARWPRPRRALRPDSGARRGRGVLLREPRLLRPAAQAQDRHHRVPGCLLGAGDQLHLPDRGDPRRPRRASGCWSAAGSRRCRGSRKDLGIWVAQGGCGRGARRDPRRVA